MPIKQSSPGGIEVPKVPRAMPIPGAAGRRRYRKGGSNCVSSCVDLNAFVLSRHIYIYVI